jgi:hypothetical protein
MTIKKIVDFVWGKLIPISFLLFFGVFFVRMAFIILGRVFTTEDRILIHLFVGMIMLAATFSCGITIWYKTQKKRPS